MNQHRHKKNTTITPFLNVLLLVCAGWYFAGCAYLHERVITSPRTHLPEETARTLVAAGHKDMIFTAEADVTVDGPQGRYSRAIALATTEPSSLRIEALPLFGLPDFYLVTQNDVMRIFLPGQGKYYIAASGETALVRFLDIDLSVEDLVRLLTGNAPLLPEDTRYEGYCGDDSCRIEAFRGTRKVASVEMPAGGGISTIDVFTGTGTRQYSASFTEYVGEGPPLLPRHILLLIEEPEKTSIEIRYRNFEFKPGDNAQSLFELPVPPGVTVELLGD